VEVDERQRMGWLKGTAQNVPGLAVGCREQLSAIVIEIIICTMRRRTHRVSKSPVVFSAARTDYVRTGRIRE